MPCCAALSPSEVAISSKVGARPSSRPSARSARRQRDQEAHHVAGRRMVAVVLISASRIACLIQHAA